MLKIIKRWLICGVLEDASLQKPEIMITARGSNIRSAWEYLLWHILEETPS